MVSYEGILAGYPHIRSRFGRVAGYVQLVRPFTLLAPLVAGMLGVLAPVDVIARAELVMAFTVGLTLALSQACGQCLNQYADLELDKMVKSYRPLPSGILSKDEALGLSWLLAIISIAFGFTVGYTFGAINLALLFFAVFYSMAPLSPRRLSPVLNVLWMAVSRGFIPMIAVISIYGSLEGGIPYAIIAFLWVMALQGTKDVPDVRGDRAFGIKTIANTYGVNGLRKWMLAFLMVYLGAAFYFRESGFMLLFPFGLLAISSLKTKAMITENTVSWVIFYAGLAAVYVLVFLS